MIIGHLVREDILYVPDLTKTWPPLPGWTAPESGIKFEGKASFYFEGLWEIEPLNVDI